MFHSIYKGKVIGLKKLIPKPKKINCKLMKTNTVYKFGGFQTKMG